jgi:hypothetical protein
MRKRRSEGKHALLAVASGALALISVLSARAQTSDPCAETRLPRSVNELIRARFPGWRREQASDLSSDDRQLWLKAHVNDCPGIAIGHFESRDRLTYALFLVRPADVENGYKLLVFDKMPNGDAYILKLTEQANGPTYDGVVIVTAPPGHYSDYEHTRISVTTKLDGFYLEFIEKGALFYYWSGRRYRTVRVSG